MERQDQTARRSWQRAGMRACWEAFNEGRWFSTFCHAPKGSHWYCGQ